MRRNLVYRCCKVINCGHIPFPNSQCSFHFSFFYHYPFKFDFFLQSKLCCCFFLLAFMLVLLVDCHITHVSKTIVSRTKSLSNIHRITIHVCQGEELNKLCFRSDPFLHSPIYPYVLKCFMYLLE